MFTSFKVFCVVFFALSFSSIIHAKEVGRSIVVLGEAWVMHGNNKAKLSSGHILQQSDIIVTGKHGRVRLLMNDGSRVYISPKSRISLKRYAYKNKRNFLAGFDMFWGKVRFLVKKMATKNTKFNVHTTTAVLGVRGTDFEVNIPVPTNAESMAFDAQLNLSDMQPLPTSVALTEGSVVVTSKSGSQQTLAPGEQVNVDESGNMSSSSSGASSSEGEASEQTSSSSSGDNSPPSTLITNAAASTAASSSVTQGVTITTPYTYGTPQPASP